MKIIECRKTFLVENNAVGNPVLALMIDLHGNPAGRGKTSLPKHCMNFFEKDGKGTSSYMELRRSLEKASSHDDIDSIMHRAAYEATAGYLNASNMGKLDKLAKRKINEIN